MAQTKIEWTSTGDNPGFSFNPWIGCAKVSSGCANCYAETLMDKRYGRVRWGKGQPRSLTGERNWSQPLRWNRDCEKSGTRAKVFCASLSDWLDDEVPLYWLAELLDLLACTSSLDWLLLTKRPENWKPRLEAIVEQGLGGAIPARFAKDWLDGNYLQNIWVGTTVENRSMVDERVPLLLKIPAVVRFLSCEPLLEEIDLSPFLPMECYDELNPDKMLEFKDAYGAFEVQPDWIIVGGESGHGARPCDVEWIKKIVQQCKDADVPVFVKQLGSAPTLNGQRLKLHDRKGGDINEFPEDLKIREMPEGVRSQC